MAFDFGASVEHGVIVAKNIDARAAMEDIA